MVTFTHRFSLTHSHPCVTTGYALSFYVYREVTEESGRTIFKTVFPRGQTGPLENAEVTSPYPTKTLLQYKRFLAQSNGTTYVHDYPELFRQATRAQWVAAKEQDPSLEVPRVLVNVTDYILDDSNELVPVAAAPDEYVVCFEDGDNMFCFAVRPQVFGFDCDIGV